MFKPIDNFEKVNTTSYTNLYAF